MKQERMETIKGWIESAKSAPVYMVGERISLDPKMIDEIRGQIGTLRGQNTSLGELNKLYRTLERAGVIDPKKEGGSFRPGVDPSRLPESEQREFYQEMRQWEQDRGVPQCSSNCGP